MRCAADFRAEARAALKGRWGLAIGIGFLAMVLGGIAGVGGLDVNFVMVEGNFQMTLDIFGQRLNPVEMMRNIGVGSAFLVWQYLSVAAALVAIVRLIVGSFVGVGYMKFNLDLIDGEEGRLETLFRYVKQWGTMLAAVLLQAVYIIGWTLLFIIPGLIAAYRYQLTGYILAENPEMGANDAITRSKELMKGNKWRLFCLDFSFIGWELLCALPMYAGYFLFLNNFSGSEAMAISIVLLLAIPLSIGFFFVRPYEETAWAAFYRDITAAPAEPDEAY